MKKSLSKKELPKGLGKQLRYLNRNLKHIGILYASVPLAFLSARWFRELLLIDELYTGSNWKCSRAARKVPVTGSSA